MDHDRQDQAQRVHDDVTLATVNLLARVVTPRASDFGRLDGLAVDDGRAGRRLATLPASESVPQRVLNPRPRAGVAPGEEDSVDGPPFREIVRQEPSRATAA
jgi:hypothetical protein